MRVELNFTADFSYLRLVRALIHEVCEPRTDDRVEIYWLVQAVDEAITNVIRHAYDGGNAGGKVSLACVAEGSDLEFRLTDFGRAFAYQPGVKLDLEKYVDEGRTGGLGMHMIQRVADRVEYTSQGGKNTLSIRRRLRGGTAAPPPA